MFGIAAITSRLSILKDLLSSVPAFGGDSGSDNVYPQTKWDKIVDSFSRMIRPILMIGVILLFVLAYRDSVNFVVFAKAIKELPDMAWYTIYTIIASWVVGRGVSDIRKANKGMNSALLDDTAITATTTTTTTTAPTASGAVTTSDTVVLTPISSTPPVGTPEPSTGRFDDDSSHDDVHDLPTDNTAIEAWQKNASK